MQLEISVVAYVFFCFTILISTTSKAAIDESYVSNYCPNTNTFSPNSTYEKNLITLLYHLSFNSVRQNGFYYTAVNLDTNNNNSNTAYGAFLCRGDLTPKTCQECVSIASKRILQSCPQRKVSIIWFAECMIRYSNQSFFNRVSEVPRYELVNTGSVTEQERSRFMQLLGDTMNVVAAQAANGNNKFATKEVNLSSFETMYTLAQCTPDLSESGCEKCLKIAITKLPMCCDGKQGGRVLFPSCNIRYQFHSFYQKVNAKKVNVTAPSPEKPTPNPPTPQEKSGISVVIIVAIVAPIVIFLLLTFADCWIISKRRRRKKYNSVPEESGVQISGVESLQFDFDTIVAATDNFCDENKLGEGGFGEVYKGTLFNGQDIAVKRLSRGSNQGIAEFKNEVFLVAKLQHRNLVRLLGFCLDGEEKMLIYELMPNKSLDYFLFDQEKVHQLNWPRRYKIIEGIARGMLYLHEDSRLRIIHRDLKPSNILLDENLNPKISDFGMARIFGADETRGITNRVVGTLGYMPPEYAMHGEFSLKTDVYSFGVLVLEIISGKKIASFRESGYADDLLSYAWKKWRDELPVELLDMSLRDSYSRVEVLRCIHVGLSCVQEDPAQRPTMQTIVVMLSSHSVTLEQPKRPAGYINSEIQQSFTTKDFENSNKSIYQSGTTSVDEASITQVYPR